MTGLLPGLVALGLGVLGIRSGDIVWIAIGGFVGFIGLLFMLGGVIALFEKEAEHRRYLDRARRHVELSPEQAIRDYASALAALPGGKEPDLRKVILAEHAELCEKTGHVEEARTDLQAMVADMDAKLAAVAGKDRLAALEQRAILQQRLGNADQAQSDRQVLVDEATRLMDSATPAEREALLKARAMAYEGLGYGSLATHDLLEATYVAETAIQRKDYKPGEGTQLVASALGVGGGAFNDSYANSQRKSALNRVVNERIALLEAGRVKAIGYCRGCRAVVELALDDRDEPIPLEGSPEVRAQVMAMRQPRRLNCAVVPRHGQPRDTERAFVMPEQADALRAQMNQERKPHWRFPLPQPHG